LLSERAARDSHRADVVMRPAAATGDHLLLFLHLAKTGGMTLADILARKFCDRRIAADRHGGNQCFSVGDMVAQNN
jgi:hypothetical protein